MSVWDPLKRVFLAAVLGLSLAGSGHGAVSYLLIQADFNGSSTLGPGETSRWVINDPGGALHHGQDILDAVFGAPVLVSGSTYKTDPTSWMADDSTLATWEVNYTLYSGIGYLVNSFKRNGIALASNFFTGQGWNYYNAGGTYVDATYFPPDYSDVPATGPYPNGIWTSGYTGTASRSLADTDGNATADSAFDAWVFGNDGYAAVPQAEVAGYPPAASSFQGATVNVRNIAAAPEPSRAILILSGLGVMLLRRRRART